MVQYKDETDFLLPIDVDEYLSISSADATKPALIWNRPALLDAPKDLPPSRGKPYKTLDAKPIRSIVKIVHMISGVSVGNAGCWAKNIFEGKALESVDS